MVSKGAAAGAVDAVGSVEVDVVVEAGGWSVAVARRRGVVGLLALGAGAEASAGVAVGVGTAALCDGLTTRPPTTNRHPRSCMADNMAMVAYIFWSWTAFIVSGVLPAGAGGGP